MNDVSTPATAALALVVEDHAQMRTMMAGVLTKLGFAPVMQADSVAAARDLIAASPPALALIDLRLPDGTGEDVVRAMRATPGPADDSGASAPSGVAIVIMTADTDMELRARLLRAGADTFVVKSEGLGAIRRAITTAAGARGLTI